MDEGTIVIDGEEYFAVELLSWAQLPMLKIMFSDQSFYVAENHETAGEAAREYWEELAQTDPEEFTCLVGEKNLIAWGLGQSAGPGSTWVNSLEEWLDLWLDTPEEQWAGYDGYELTVDAVAEDIVDDLGFTPTVAYRWN